MRASEPFQFETASYLIRIGNHTACNLVEMQKGLEACSDGSIFYHTFQSLGRHHFLTEGFSNDFAQWALSACNRPCFGGTTGFAGYPRLRISGGAAVGSAASREQLLFGESRQGRSDSLRAFLLLRDSGGRSGSATGGMDAGGIPRLHEPPAPRLLAVPFHHFAFTASSSYERLFVLARKRPGTKRTGAASGSD